MALLIRRGVHLPQANTELVGVAGRCETSRRDVGGTTLQRSLHPTPTANGMRDESWKGRSAKPHHAAAFADCEDDHAPGDGILETPCTERD